MENALTIIISIVIIDLLSIITPGQDFALITRNTLKYSKRTGIATTWGIVCMTFLHCLLAMGGLSLLITQNDNLLSLIKTLGAMYLIYLGAHYIRHAKNIKIESNLEKKKETIPGTIAFKTGFIANTFNIEPIMAFVSVFAIILPINTPLWIKLALCIALPLSTLVYYLLVVNLLSLNKVQNILQTQMKFIEQIIGACLLFFGYKSLVSQNK